MDQILKAAAYGILEFPHPVSRTLRFDALIEQYKKKVGKNPGVSRRACADVFSHVLARIWKFGNLSEELTSGMIRRGVPKAGISGVDMSARSIRRVLAFLAWVGLVEKATTTTSFVLSPKALDILERFYLSVSEMALSAVERKAFSKCYWALMQLRKFPPEELEQVQQHRVKSRAERIRRVREEMASRKPSEMEQDLDEFLYEESLPAETEDEIAAAGTEEQLDPSSSSEDNQEATISAVSLGEEEPKALRTFGVTLEEAFERGLIKERRKPMKLDESVREAAKRAKELSEMKEKGKRESIPFVYESGSFNPHGVLVYFTAVAEEVFGYKMPALREKKYYRAAVTYLRQCYSAGLDEQGIRDEIKDILRYWPDLKGITFLKSTSKKQNDFSQFELTIPDFPDFMFFSNNRSELSHLAARRAEYHKRLEEINKKKSIETPPRKDETETSSSQASDQNDALSSLKIGEDGWLRQLIKGR